MKKFLAVAVSLAAVTGSAMAQEPNTYNENGYGEGSAYAYVRVPLTVMQTRPLNLGVLERGMDETQIQKGQTAEFNVRGDEGDLIWVEVNNGENIVLHALHNHGDVEQAAEEGSTTPGPGQYFTDDNGVPNTPTTMIVVEPSLTYRFVNNNEQYSLPWDLPTWTAGNGYSDAWPGGPYTIPAGTLPEGIGQVNVYVGGTYSTHEAQQRGAYEGELNMLAWYDEAWQMGADGWEAAGSPE